MPPSCSVRLSSPLTVQAFILHSVTYVRLRRAYIVYLMCARAEFNTWKGTMNNVKLTVVPSESDSGVLWALTCDIRQCGFLTSVDKDKPVQPPFKLRNPKWCSVSSLTLVEYLSDKQRLWSDCAYAPADPRICWSHIPHCLKSHVGAHMCLQLLCKTLTCTLHLS